MKDDHKVQKSTKKYEEHRVHKKCRRKRAKCHSRSRSRSRDSSSSRSRDRSSSRSRDYSRSRSRDLSRSRSRDYSRSRSRDFSRSRSRGYSRSRSRDYSRSRSRGRSRSRSRRRSRSDSRSRSKSPVFAKYKYSPEVIRNFRSPDHRKEEKPKVKSEDSRSYESRKDSHRGKSDVNKSYRSRDTKTKSEDSRSNGRNPGINVKPEPLDDNGAQGRSSGRRGDDKPRWGKKNDKEEKKPMENKAKPDFGLSGKLAEEVNTYKGVVIKYSEPPEARMPKRRWRLYPFKGDQALPTLYIHRQSAYLIGRDRVVADLPIDHPSCSKQHAVLQYRVVPYTKENGMKGNRIRPYIIDLDSANGTFVNNKKIEPRKYVELLEKDVIKFAFSSREYVVLHEHSKDDDEDDNVLMVNE